MANGDVRAAVESEPVCEATARRAEHAACCEGAETMRLALANMAVLYRCEFNVGCGGRAFDDERILRQLFSSSLMILLRHVTCRTPVGLVARAHILSFDLIHVSTCSRRH
jgi:hypothetical protein